MNIEDALEVIERLPYIRTIQAPSDSIVESLLEEALDKDDCIEWVKIIKTCYVRKHDRSAKARPLTKKMCTLYQEAQTRFRASLASALQIDEENVDAYIQRFLKEND